MAYITMIAAIGPNNALGKNNELIYHIPEDLKFFKEQTINKKIILGRKTLESLPHLLPKRKHLVLTHQDLEENDSLQVFHTLEELLAYLDSLDEEVMVIGGENIYRQFLDYADKLILTEISSKNEPDADAFFPPFDKTKWKKEIISSGKHADLTYNHVVYIKK